MFRTITFMIFLSYIKKKMQEKDLFKKYTMQELFDEFDVIECFEQPDHELRLGEITKRQAELYQTIEISTPSLQ